MPPSIAPAPGQPGARLTAYTGEDVEKIILSVANRPRSRSTMGHSRSGSSLGSGGAGMLAHSRTKSGGGGSLSFQNGMFAAPPVPALPSTFAPTPTSPLKASMAGGGFERAMGPGGMEIGDLALSDD